jgi:hypothetical protein
MDNGSFDAIGPLPCVHDPAQQDRFSTDLSTCPLEPFPRRLKTLQPP